MRILFLLLVTTISFGQIPDEIKLKEEFATIGTDFSYENLSIDQNVIDITTSFDLEVSGKKIAEARQQIISIGSKINIYDEYGVNIGYVQEELFTSWGFYSRYTIYDHNGSILASSEKHKFMATSFTIKNNSGKVLCKITRPMFNLVTDTWDIKFYGNSIDRRLIVFIPCYKTYRDNNDD